MNAPGKPTLRTRAPATARSKDLPAIALAMLTGVFAFAWAGFLGNTKDPNFFIHNPWPLYLWLCLLIILVELIILGTPAGAQKGAGDSTATNLRNEGAVRRARVALLSVTLVCIPLVAVVRLKIGELGWLTDFIQSIGNIFNQYRQLWFALLNLALILLYWAGVLLPRLWRQGEERPTASEESAGEKIAADFLVAIIVSLALAPIFSTWIVAGQPDLRCRCSMEA
jgi:hypothetical protein